MLRSTLLLAVALPCLVACGARTEMPQLARAAPALYPGESREMRSLIRTYSQKLGIPETLMHRVIQRESDYRADARNGPYFGLMQILPETARGMGFQGQPSDLLDPATNLEYAGRYLRGAWIVSDGDEEEAVGWYARGYYYEARDRCLLVETGLRDNELRC